ncbi:MAG TPA: methyltransferase [Actinomycetota bacterium]|nr:methyltransferase [Actinomycetota bacterium]
MIQTGEPAFNLVFGAAWEEHLATEPHARTRFNRLVAARKELLADHLADHRWTGQETVIDLGGGNGALLQDLLARRTGLRGIVFDLPEVVAEATERLRAAGLTDRCQTVAGSVFRDVPQGGDVYLLCHILHGWDDDHARQILQAVRRAIPDHGRLLVVEEVLAPPNQPGGKIMDLLMAPSAAASGPSRSGAPSSLTVALRWPVADPPIALPSWTRYPRHPLSAPAARSLAVSSSAASRECLGRYPYLSAEPTVAVHRHPISPGIMSRPQRSLR